MKKHNQIVRSLTIMAAAILTCCTMAVSQIPDTTYNVRFSTTTSGIEVVRQFRHGNVLTIYADNDSRHIFKGWSDGTTANPRTVTVSSDTSFIARYDSIGTGVNALSTATVSLNGCDTSLTDQYAYIADLTMTAEPDLHYHFVRWSDGNTENPRQIRLTSDTNLVAYIAIDQYTFTLSGEHVTTTGGGTYGWGSQVTISAIPDSNYHFVCWSDGDSSATRTFTAEEDITLTAYVEGDPFTLTTVAPKGSVTGGGTYPYNTVVTLTATPDEHYHFACWSDGDTNRIRTVTVKGNKAYVAVFVIDQHRVTLTADNGTVTGAGLYDYGTEVQITATPNQHYHFVQWSDGDKNATRSITVTQDIALTATFEGNPITIAANTTNGSVVGTGTYPYRTTVSLMVVPDIHYRFVSWSDGNTDNPRSLVLTQDTTLTAITDVTQHNVTVVAENATVTGEGVYGYNSTARLTVTPNEHYRFYQWSDGITTATRNITVTSDTTLYAIVILQTHNVAATSAHGTVAGGGEYNYGTSVTLEAAPSEHYHFMSWSDGEKTNPRTFVITQDTSFVAVMGIDSFQLYCQGEHGNTLGSGTYPYNQTVQIEAIADEHYHFVEWSDGGTDNPRDVVVTSDTTFTAVIEIDSHNISDITANGRISGAGMYEYNTQVTLTAIPDAHYHFVEWSDGNTSNPRSLTLTQDTTFNAIMSIDRHSLTVTDQHCTTTGVGEYDYGTTVTLTANADEHYHFVRWSDGATDNPRNIVLTNDTSFTPIVSLDIHNVTTITSNGTISGGGMYEYNSQVTLYAIPDAHYHFVEWSDGNTSNPRSLTLTQDTTLGAVISIDSHTVAATGEHVTTTGTGEYDYGTTVTLTATADEHYHFVRWSDGSTENPRNIVLTKDTSFTPITAADIHNVSVTTTNGTIAGGGSYAYSTLVTLYAIPNAHYHFVEWNDGNVANPRTFTLTQDSSFSATMAIDRHTISVGGQHATTTGQGEYDYGTTVTLTATAADHYHFTQWSDGNTENPRNVVLTKDTSFTAITAADIHSVTVSSANGTVTGGGTYSYNSQVTLQAIPNEHYHFVAWNDSNTSNPRLFTLTQDTAFGAIMAIDRHTVAVSSPNGTVSGSGEYDYGTAVTLTAVADEHYHFLKWSDGNTDNPRSIIVAGNTTLTAIMTADIHSVTANSANGIVTGGGTYPYNSQVTLQAIPNEHYHFVEWNDSNIANPRLFTLTQDTAFSAIMAIDRYTVTVNGLNATVTGSGEYDYGTAVTLTAVADEHYHFSQWSDGNTDNPRSIVLSKDTSFTAIMATDIHSVTVSSANGTVTGGGTYPYNSQVTLQAIPNEHYHFVAWNDGSTANPRLFTLTQDTAFGAIMAIDRHTVTVNGLNATVTGSGEYDYGTAVTLTAAADEHYSFVSWSDGSTYNPRSLIVTSDTVLTALTALEKVTLTVTAYNGTVEGSGSYDYGSTVKLTVIPEQGYMLYQWSDGSTSNPRTVVLTSDTLLIATCKQFFEVKVSASDKYTVTGAGTYFAGDIATLEVTSLDEDYEFSHWSDYNTDNPRSVVVNSDISLAVVMKEKQTAVENIAEDTVSFMLAPNPVGKSEDVQISGYGDVDEDYMVTILDAAGNVVSVYAVDAFPFAVAAPSVDGTYFVRIVSGKHSTTLKLIVK